MNKRQIHEQVKADILEAVEAIRASSLGDDAADYILEHLHIDDERMTFRYDGDPGVLCMERIRGEGCAS